MITTVRLDRKRVKLFIWISLAYFILWFIIDVSSDAEHCRQLCINNLWRLIYIAVNNYIFFEFTSARLSFTWRGIWRTGLLLIMHLFLFSVGLYAWRCLGIYLSIYTPLRVDASTVEGIGYHMPYSFFSVLFYGTIRHVVDYHQLKQDAQMLRIEKQTAELNYLKSQTNPHFLFNTLNNIYSLARDKSELAPESILRLSKILRFMLYETSGPFIALENEMKIITDYLELEKLRYDDTLRIHFHHSAEDMKQAIPPLLLIPLVENAFKHGVSETRGQPYVDIHLSVAKQQLTFTVINSTGTNSTEKPLVEKIGLSNLRRQLELLYKDYSLSTEPRNGEFYTKLFINLASHA